MPYLPTAQEWHNQSTLLIEARPSTTRISTKYTIPPTSTTGEAKPGSLILKTYDAASGVTLKYRTDKAAEVARLVQIMGRLGRGMAGLKSDGEKDAGEDVDVDRLKIVDGVTAKQDKDGDKVREKEKEKGKQATVSVGSGVIGKKGKKRGKK